MVLYIDSLVYCPTVFLSLILSQSGLVMKILLALLGEFWLLPFLRIYPSFTFPHLHKGEMWETHYVGSAVCFMSSTRTEGLAPSWYLDS